MAKRRQNRARPAPKRRSTARKAPYENAAVATEAEVKQGVKIPASLTVKQFADLIDMSAVEVIKQLMRNGMMANINEVIDHDTAVTVASDLGYKVLGEKGKGATSAKKIKKYERFSEDDTSVQKSRPPVVTIMGHVDHGKTSLLDAIRQTNVTATEAGEITQHIGAYQVDINGQKITFLDTPGHEAFTAMRAHGAKVTDIAILVVAADDGVMPQTLEAIAHARAAGVPIVVALNKVDKPDANPQRVKQQLADHDVLIEEWGGDVVCIPVSAKKQEGISDLLENLLIVAELEDLKANPERNAIGVVIEAKLDKTRGALATVLVQTGTLRVGDPFIVGDISGKIKAMFNDKGKHLRKAEPASPVEILGMESVPKSGDTLTVTATEKEARIQAEKRQDEKRLSLTATKPLSLSNFFSRVSDEELKELSIILKTDVQGSIEPIKTSLVRLNNDEVKVNILHSDSGSITEGDVLLALASNGIILGFNTGTEPGAIQIAVNEGVDIRNYEVIYKLVDDVEKAVKGMLAPTYVEVIAGHGEVRAIFSARGNKVAGIYITEGKIIRGSQARIIRHSKTIFESSVNSLKRFKDDVKEVTSGFECGIGIEGYNDLEVGDIIESFRMEQS